MILGKIIGKTTTNTFSFIAEENVLKFDYVQVLHNTYGFVLSQIIELERTDKTLAKCQVIGFMDDEKLKPIRIPFEPGSEVLIAEDELIKKSISHSENGAYIGKLEGKDIPVFLDLRKLLTKHLAVLAKSGAGKSYTVGVILEEILEQKIPLIIIDPHGEYSTLKLKNDDEKDLKKLAIHNLKASSYKTKEFADTKLFPDAFPLKLNNHISQAELLHLIPGKLNAAQTGLLYSAMSKTDRFDFESVIFELQHEETSAKWPLINILEGLKNTGLFSNSPTSLNELVKSGIASIINLKGISPDVQEIIVYKLLNDLFEARKKNKVPPFFCVIEESHNFCPERSFGEKKTSNIIRTIASEGRKFGMGLCVISQRPARVDKSVLSQCTTQIILKITNPNDIKALSNSVEGLTNESETEIKNLPIGTALLTGISDMPLIVNIRPRKSKHGGETIDILKQPDEKDILEQLEDFEEQELIPLIKPSISPKDLKLMSETPIEVETILKPCRLFTCKTDKEFDILVDLNSGNVVVDVEKNIQKKIPNLQALTRKELGLLQTAFKLKKFSLETITSHFKGLNLEKELNSLVEKKFFVRNNIIEYKNSKNYNDNNKNNNDKNDDNKNYNYGLSDEYILTRLENVSCKRKINFEKLKGIKTTEKTSVDKIKELLSKFADVIDIKDVFLAVYETRNL